MSRFFFQILTGFPCFVDGGDRFVCWTFGLIYSTGYEIFFISIQITLGKNRTIRSTAKKSRITYPIGGKYQINYSGLFEEMVLVLSERN